MERAHHTMGLMSRYWSVRHSTVPHPAATLAAAMEGEPMSTTPQPPFVTADPDGLLAAVLARLGDALAIRTGSDAESEWVNAALNLSVGHPDPFVRASMAQTCSLRQLRRMVNDPHIAVRAACAANPFVIDVDIQLALAGDAEAVVVHALLDHTDPYLDVCEVIIAGPHASARKRLAFRNLRTGLLERLAVDSHRAVATAAQATLAHRAGLRIKNAKA